jgi:NifB/MoaA-like Fe-S oxidoreductase
MAPFLRDRAGLLAGATRARVEVVEVANDFFGDTVTVAGLLAGADIRRSLGSAEPGDIVLLPAEALNADRVFIDGLPLEELEAALAPARVVRGYEIGEALAAL